MGIKLEYEVEFSDGRIELVVADQRDMAKWEVQDFYDPSRMHLQVRFYAWSALNREQRYTSSFDKFNKVECVSVSHPSADEDEDEEEQEGGQGLDPGRSDPGAGS